jgi:hypothetical protein
LAKGSQDLDQMRELGRANHHVRLGWEGRSAHGQDP